ncbi:MAG: hypothetical protein WCE49_18230 [Terrimicrobiaceae bacterium]
MNCMGYASIDANRLGGKLILDRRIPERVDAHPDQSLQRADVTSKDLANANLGGTRRLVFVANHPQGHHVPGVAESAGSEIQPVLARLERKFNSG